MFERIRRFGVLAVLAACAAFMVFSCDPPFDERQFLHGKGYPDSIALSLSERACSVLDDPFLLTAAPLPADTGYPGIVWISSSPSVATVSPSGLVTPIDLGIAVIRASSDSPSREFAYAECSVSVQTVVATIAGSAGVEGSADGSAADARFHWPRGIAMDQAGALLVSDCENHSIRKIDADGTVSLVANSWLEPSNGITDYFHEPYGIAVGHDGTIYVADLEVLKIRKITSSGSVTTMAGSGTLGVRDGAGGDAQFGSPISLAVDGAGNVFVADGTAHSIRKIAPNGEVVTIAGALGEAGFVDGYGTAARFNAPVSLAIDDAGDIYVADYGNNAIRRIGADSVVRTVFGPGDGIDRPTSVAVDGEGVVYYSSWSSDGCIYKVAPGGERTVIAGSESENGSADGLGLNARFLYLIYLCIGNDGALYASDTFNDTIRKITVRREL
jgi:serine/threonine protein kinase, bacterial